MRKVLILGLALSLMGAFAVQAADAERVVSIEQYPAHLDAGLVGLTSESPAALLQERMRSETTAVVAYELFVSPKPKASQEVAHGVGEGITQTTIR